MDVCPDSRPARYSRQSAPLAGLGADQALLARSSVAVCGAGALGCAFAVQLSRMGFGFVRIADFDTVEEVNLHRQILFDESDCGRPKALAAAEKARLANCGVAVEVFPARVEDSNFADFASGADMVLDATDSATARYMLNDCCIGAGIPLVLTAVAGTSGMVMPVVRGGADLRRVFPVPPREDEIENVKTRGVLPPAVLFAASLAATVAVKLLAGTQRTDVMYRFDVALGTCRPVAVFKS